MAPRRVVIPASLCAALLALLITAVCVSRCAHAPSRPAAAPDAGPPADGAKDASTTADAVRPDLAPAGAEAALMTRARLIVDTRPGEALALLRRAGSRYPRSRVADERVWLEMKALVHLGRIAAARDHATDFFRRFPGSRYGPRVHRLTGVHPRPRPGPR